MSEHEKVPYFPDYTYAKHPNGKPMPVCRRNENVIQAATSKKKMGPTGKVVEKINVKLITIDLFDAVWKVVETVKPE